ncbi:LpxI family protein [Jannaschia sp. M317]|uniref:LpxI family protein n=1 Tax=Jannaschia sp. M317 TaxID=2867011 RepID=UPI0021A3004C|nr:UDP-2,3-diacylglucosamine diphosphatase LpxI [Jannaschia sp. M317]UWQ16660.1 UDP-2,3-diacylglucosamine diphosphatase LpxI [Jannaschia sp. M317]
MTTALIAGQGALPAIVARALDQAGADWVAHHLDGFAPDDVPQAVPFRIEHLGSLIQTLVGGGVTRVCFAGAIARPPIDPSALDAATLPLVPRLMQAIQAGDDGALRAVVALFEEAGMSVVGAADLAPALLDLPEVGTPSRLDQTDIARAAQVHGALASVDVGQGCVVAAGQVLAVETLPGTDWMLDTLAAGFPARPDGGVFFKASKPGQDRRVDLPAIGPATVRRAAAAGLSGLALERGGVMVLDPAGVAQALADTGLFLTAWDR